MTSDPPSKGLLLAVDIGNTSVSFGVIRGHSIIRRYACETKVSRKRLRPDIQNILKRIRSRFPDIRRAIVCSVVPDVLKICEHAISQTLRIKPAVVGRDVRVPIANNYRNPRQVGQDRLVCSYAVKSLYGQPAIVIDFGTATTFDVISKSGSYEGGIITSGVRLSIEALFHETALLPRISVVKGPRVLIGKDTKESMLSGIFHGYGALCCGLIDRITKQLGGRPRVVITGGYTRLMKRYIKDRITIVDKDLVFKGMRLLADCHFS